MRRLLFLLLCVITAFPVVASNRDSSFVVSLLNEARSLPRTTCFPLHFARKFIGHPYVAHTLEVNDDEQLVVNTRQLDCTTLVENVTALTLCVYRNLYAWRDFQNALVEMRYRHGRINGYASRLHYFSDWIDDNTHKELVYEVQTPDPPFSAVQNLSVNYMSQHPASYKALKAHPEMVSLIASQENMLTGRKYRYIPKADIADTKVMRNTIHDGDIIAITCSKPGLDIAHLGFAVWRKDGLHLLNASQLHKKVIEEPMTIEVYLSKHPTHTGIRVIRIQK